MDDKIEIGVVAKPQGINGEIKINLYSGETTRVKKLKTLKIDGISFKVIGLKELNGALIASLFGVSDRNSAELLRGKKVVCDKKELKELPSGEYFVCDLIGCDFYADGEFLGKITDISSYKTDVITVENDGKKIVFPFVKKLNFSFDKIQRKITVDKKALSEVALYED